MAQFDPTLSAAAQWQRAAFAALGARGGALASGASTPVSGTPASGASGAASSGSPATHRPPRGGLARAATDPTVCSALRHMASGGVSPVIGAASSQMDASGVSTPRGSQPSPRGACSPLGW